jgi:peptidoglycan hydrolase CwlO-like protein
MRPVIWAILAILVVLAIVFVVVARKGAGTSKVNPMSEADFTNFADRMDKNVARFEERSAKLSADGKDITPVTAKIEELKSAITDLRSSPTEEKVAKVRSLYNDVKKVYREAGGKETGGDTGGE